MRAINRFTALAIAAVLLTACFGQPDSSSAVASAVPSAAASEGPSSAAPAESQPATATTEPIPSDELGAFSCATPVIEDATVAVANIVDVRVGSHVGYDRVVFEFEQGTPELTLDRASPPFSEDASGLPLDVEGVSFLRLTMRGGSKQTDAGTSSYDGPTNFDPAFRSLVDLVEGGDFERQSTWYFGLSAESCLRVLLLDGPPRLVVDVQH
jgi:hypothetical protein